jgi:hypothetical protein
VARLSPFALFHPRELSASFASTESHSLHNPPAKKSLQAQPLAIFLLCGNPIRDESPRGKAKLPSAERPWAGKPSACPPARLASPAREEGKLVSKGSTKMTAMNDEPRSPSDMGSIIPARRLPPAGFPRGRRATKARGRVSSKMPGLLTTPAGWLGGPGRLPRRPCSRRLSSSEGSAAQGLARARSKTALSRAAALRGPLSGGSLPRRSLAGWPRAEPRGDAFRGTENKPLRAISNRKSNDSRKLATLSEPTTSKFLIATKTHFSEEKAKRE